ncbi:hypothetical protein EON65_52470, partial [archaeon]
MIKTELWMWWTRGLRAIDSSEWGAATLLKPHPESETAGPCSTSTLLSRHSSYSSCRDFSKVIEKMMVNNGRGLVAGTGGTVTTKKGKNRDQYGRKFGKKHNEAIFEFTKNLWLQDAVTSLKNLLTIESAQQVFMTFLKTEYGEAQLEFLIEAQKLETMDQNTQGPAVMRVYQMFMSVGDNGIGQQGCTAATQQMWDSINQSGSVMMDPQTALYKIRAEAETTLKMLAFDAFPRFVKSKYCQQVLSALQQSGNSQIESMLSSVDSKVPQDA